VLSRTVSAPGCSRSSIATSKSSSTLNGQQFVRRSLVRVGSEPVLPTVSSEASISIARVSLSFCYQLITWLVN
jgi:hypothetical protein